MFCQALRNVNVLWVQRPRRPGAQRANDLSPAQLWLPAKNRGASRWIANMEEILDWLRGPWHEWDDFG